MTDSAKPNLAAHIPFSNLMGMVITEASGECVKAEMLVRPDLCTLGGILHGGAYMAFADTLGATGAFFHLPKGKGTATIESKTNFLGAAKEGETVYATCTPIKVGKTISVWQTELALKDGTPVALVTQSQIVK